ncbi:MAG TPA: Trp biosynthesis-associated membrane protein [Streptosporangiaceae bacterium]|nr:Trp biosynthesis-associated membrane protein [Streptosporangiaceae bacterium]
MTSENMRAPGLSASRRRRQFAVLLLVGAAGAGGVLLATRQVAAHVVVTAPRPLPRTVTPVNWQELLPVVAPLAVAALASMAAVLATRGWLRRITGLIAAALGVGIAVLAAGRVTDAAVLAAAGHANLSPANGAGGGIAPGSTTAGGTGGTAAGSLGGFPAHVELAGSGWRVLIIAGAVLIIGIGIGIVIAATRLPAMSGKYERTAAAAGTGGSAGGSGGSSPRAGTAAAGGSAGAGGPAGAPARAATARAGVGASGSGRGRSGPGNAAGMWESLTAGADPTVGSDEDASQ